MRVAALFDIHGNLPALEAVLDDLRAAGVDRCVVGGDVTLGPMPRATLERLLALGVPVDFVRGNCDREMLAARAGRPFVGFTPLIHQRIRWAADELLSEQVRHMESWPLTSELEVPGLGRVLFCHATPRDDNELFSRVTPDDRIASAFAGVDAALVVCGHTHMPFDRTVAGIRVVNAGSVGMPFTEPGADWLLLGPGIEPRRSRYDLDAAADRILATTFPGAGELVENNLRRTPVEAETVAAIERAIAAAASR